MFFISKAIRNFRDEIRERKRLKKRTIERDVGFKAWVDQGKPGSYPPHIVKQKVLEEYANKYRLKIFIETGTLYGDMIEAMIGVFKKIYSIELDQKLYEGAKKRFQNQSYVEIIKGDSGLELPKILKKVDQPALFWLDGHYSGGITARGEKDTPIYEELDHIFKDALKGHIIIIDDARLFGVDPAYPSLEELTCFVRSKRNDLKVSVEDDMIRITPMTKKKIC